MEVLELHPLQLLLLELHRLQLLLLEIQSQKKLSWRRTRGAEEASTWA